MSAFMRCLAGAVHSAPAATMLPVGEAVLRGDGNPATPFMLAALAACIIGLFPADAGAVELPKPSPFAETLPAQAGKCLEVEQMKAQLGHVIAEIGGRGLMFFSGVQQRFADEWRRELALDPVTISVTLVWLREAALIAEFDKDGCLLTMTRMSLDEFVRLVHAGAGKNVAAPPAPTLRPIVTRL